VTSKILVIISCFNEEGRVGQVIRNTRKAMPETDIVVIDDGSVDESVAEAIRNGVRVLRHPCNMGAGAAAETGYLYAVRYGYDILLQLDGDGQHPPHQLPDLLRTLQQGEADLVIGSRYLRSEDHKDTPFVRKFGHRVFSLIVGLLTGIRVYDPTSGFRGLNRKALRLFSDNVYPNDYPDSDVILMSHLAGLRMKEIPVHMEEREGGVSMHSGLTPIYYGFKMTLSMFIVLLNWRQWKNWRRDAAEPGQEGGLPQ